MKGVHRQFSRSPNNRNNCPRLNLPKSYILCRRVPSHQTPLLWFYFTLLCIWLTKLAPLSQPMRSKTKNKSRLQSHAFSRAWHRLHVSVSSSDWFVVLFTSVVIGQSNYFGFGFTKIKSNPPIQHPATYVSSA